MALISNPPETPTGVINGINTIFTLSQNIAQIVAVFVDGAPYTSAVTVAGNQITLPDAPTVSIQISYYTTTPPSTSTGTTYSNLLLKLASKLGNRSTKFFTPDDRAAALNWARTQMSFYNFPELIQVTQLTFTPVTLNGVSAAVSGEPVGLNRYVKIWDTSSRQEFGYIQPTDFDTGNAGNVFTREIIGGIRYTYVLPPTTTTLQVRYAQAITLFDTDGSVRNEFDSHYDDVIIDGAINWLGLKGRDINDLNLFTDSFDKQISRLYQNQSLQGGTPQHNRFQFYGEKFDILNPGFVQGTLS